MEVAIEEMSTSYHNAEAFVNAQVDEALEKCEQWKLRVRKS
jgi:hypothetical protein